MSIHSFAVRNIMMACLLTSSAALAGWEKTGAAEATFYAKGPVGFKIVGKTPSVKIHDDGTQLTFTVRLDAIDTGNGLRNRHMREDLVADTYPLVTLQVPLASLKVPGAAASTEKAQGTFGIHGQTKVIPFSYTASCKNKVCSVEGSAQVNLKDYGVKIRSYLGITVKPDIRISAKFQIKQ